MIACNRHRLRCRVARAQASNGGMHDVWLHHKHLRGRLQRARYPWDHMRGATHLYIAFGLFLLFWECAKRAKTPYVFYTPLKGFGPSRARVSHVGERNDKDERRESSGRRNNPNARPYPVPAAADCSASVSYLAMALCSLAHRLRRFQSRQEACQSPYSTAVTLLAPR